MMSAQNGAEEMGRGPSGYWWVSLKRPLARGLICGGGGGSNGGCDVVQWPGHKKSAPESLI